jgi:hypothetical protein
MQHGVSDRGDSHAEPARAGRDGMLAWTALAGAVLASSCCVLPLVFVLVGLGGTWVASLRALGWCTVGPRPSALRTRSVRGRDRAG